MGMKRAMNIDQRENNIGENTMKCPKCKSKKVVAHTDANLRKEKNLVWQCFKCNNLWKTDWDKK